MEYHQFSVGVSGITRERTEEIAKMIEGSLSRLNVDFEPQCDGEIVFIESFEFSS